MGKHYQEQLRALGRRIYQYAKEYWWVWLLWKPLEDRVMGWANQTIDSTLASSEWVTSVKTALVAFDSTGLGFYWNLVALTVLFILILAYRDTRKVASVDADQPLPQLLSRSTAKTAFVITLVEAVLFLCLFAWIYGERTEIHRERIQSRDDQIANLRLQLDAKQKDTSSVPTAFPPDTKQKVESNVPTIPYAKPSLTPSELHQQAQSYSINERNRQDFIRALSSSGKHTIRITCAAVDPSSCSLAQQLKDLLISSEWNVAAIGYSTFGDPPGPPKGTIVQVKEGEWSVPPGAILLLDLFKHQKITPRLEQRPPDQVSPSDFAIYLGPQFEQ